MLESYPYFKRMTLGLSSQLILEIQLYITQWKQIEINRNEFMLNYDRSTNMIYN